MHGDVLANELIQLWVRKRVSTDSAEPIGAAIGFEHDRIMLTLSPSSEWAANDSALNFHD